MRMLERIPAVVHATLDEIVLEGIAQYSLEPSDVPLLRMDGIPYLKNLVNKKSKPNRVHFKTWFRQAYKQSVHLAVVNAGHC